MFEKAIRNKLRFDTNRGMVTTEDLWDMPLTHGTGFSLDNIAKDLHREIEAEEKSFVEENTKENELLALGFDVVKHVIKVKLEEQKAVKKAMETRERKAKILAIMADKQDESLKESSMDDLQKMLDEL